VGKIFLEPFGLHDLNRFFTFHEGALDQILDGNSEAKDGKHYLKKDDFYLARKNRPFLILVGTLLAQQDKSNPDELYIIEITPLYVGVRKRFLPELKVKGKKRTRAIGGGYVEPFGYDSFAPKEGASAIGDRWKVRLKAKKSDILKFKDSPFNKRYRFTLSDAIGISSSAPLVTLAKTPIRNVVFPEFRHWPVEAITGHYPLVETNELQHGDGGDIDNLAIMPLLARRVENILVFINTRSEFTPQDTCESISEEFTDDLVSLFQQTEKLRHNVVFAQGKESLTEICQFFKDKRAEGKPLVFCQSYNVVANTRHDIQPYTTKICWVYLDRVQKWIDALPDNGGPLTRELIEGMGKFDTFPYFETFRERKLRVIDLDRERVQALSNLAAWTVFEAADYIKDGLEGAQLESSGIPNPYT
jgi:hypothetical protein